MFSKEAQKVGETMSASKIAMWGDCPQKFAYIYLHGMRRPPNGALVMGRAWDEHKSSQKSDKKEDGYWAKVMKEGKHPSVKDSQDLFAEHFDAQFQDDEVAAHDWRDEKLDKGQLLDLGVKATALWQPQVGVVHIPKFMQQKFQLRIPNAKGGAFSVNGIIDTALIEAKDVNKEPLSTLHDDKTAGQSWLHSAGTKAKPNPLAGTPNRNALGGLQAAAYTLGAKHAEELKGKVKTDEIVWDVMVKTKDPKIQRVVTKVSPLEQHDYLKLAEAVRLQAMGAVDHGFFPYNRKSNMCSKKWCPFWKECVQEHGGEVAP